MKRIRVSPDEPDREALGRASRVLRTGGIVAYPTETFYALGANALDVDACGRLRRLKGREAGKAFPIIVADLEHLKGFCKPLPRTVVTLAERFWPGPLTLVVPVCSGASGALGETVAVRVPGLKVACELARVAGLALTATSANRSQSPPARSAEEIEGQLGPGVDLLLDGGVTKGGRPSTIVDLTGSEPKLLRRGVVAFRHVLRALEAPS